MDEGFSGLADALRGAYYALRGRMDDILDMGSTRGLNMEDALVLAALQSHGVLTVERLAAVVGRSVSSVSRQLGSMQQRHLVRKQPRADDRRVVEIYLTNAAQAQVPEVHAKVAHAHGHLVRGLSLTEQRELVRMLRVIAANGPAREG